MGAFLSDREATTTDLQIEHVPIDHLRPDVGNPRRIGDAESEALTQSIRQFGLVDPIIARREDSTVIGGHQRLVAARRLGHTTIPVVFLDLPVEQSRLLNLALNKISGEWDEELLARLLADLDASAADLTLTGFDDDEIKKLLRSLDQREKRERAEAFDLDAALEAAQGAHGAKRGDLWALGDHRLLVGDATDPGDVARLLNGERAQIAFCDPSYNVSYGDHGGQQQGQRKRRLKNDALNEDQFAAFCRAWAQSLLDHTDGAVYVCLAIQFFPIVQAAMQAAGGHWSDTLIWTKDRFVLGRADYQRQYEPIWYGWRDGAKRCWRGGRDQGNVLRVKRPSSSELHPTMKPLELVERAIGNSSKPGDIVLDLFLGSGTTLIAAERTGRVCYGLEIDPHYAQVALLRWEAFSGGKAERVDAG